jgi:murein DD-endopeptidase MepM/ murein hydrolase activator NlpD
MLSAVLLVSGAPPARAEVTPAPGGGWPVGGPVEVLRAFDPPARTWGRGHRGVDLAAPVGAPVLAAAAGRISYAGTLAGRGVVVVDHGRLRTTYEPVRRSVRVGDAVSAGSVIGTLEAGGHCGVRSCLHWGLLEGERYLDPLSVIAAGGPADLRLLPAAARVVAERRAAAREAAARRAAAAGGIGRTAPFDASLGRHGLLRPVPGGISSPYGRRFHPVLHVWKLHDGTDFGAPCGTPIRAPAAGRVINRSYDAGYGHRLMIDHGTLGGRGLVTGFNHATRYTVRVGQAVRRGQVIGHVGSTGYSTGCHLHLMVWLNGARTDPMRVF